MGDVVGAPDRHTHERNAELSTEVEEAMGFTERRPVLARTERECRFIEWLRVSDAIRVGEVGSGIHRAQPHRDRKVRSSSPQLLDSAPSGLPARQAST